MSEMKRKAVVAGHICLDITPTFDDSITASLAELMTPGNLINVKHAEIHTGGAVANSGLAMSLLGIDTTLIGKIGDDLFGSMISSILKNYAIKNEMIIDKNTSTSYTIVIAAPNIDRIFLHNAGANDTFCCDDISKKALRDIDLFHFGYPPLMKKMYDNEGEQLKQMFEMVHKSDVITSLDMAVVDPLSDAGKQDWIKILKGVLPCVDFFIPSIEELCYILDKDRYQLWHTRSNGCDITKNLSIKDDIKPLVTLAKKAGAKNIIIKCGAAGLYYSMGTQEDFCRVTKKLNLDMSDWFDKEGFENSYLPEKILSGVGAGDTTIAAFLAAMLKGYTMQECLQLSTATGAQCVSHYDALGGIIPLDDLLGKIKGGWEKQYLIRE